MEIENHPFEPFLPANARVLFLGSFPAKPLRWSMNFFYPNFSNDFWRIMGLLFYDNPAFFEIRKGGAESRNRWNETAIRNFCSEKGIALSDTAARIRRLKGNASDAALDIVAEQDISALLEDLPCCKAIATTGTLASEVVSRQFDCGIPPIGGKTGGLALGSRTISFYRLPSTSRAFPKPLAEKAEAYKRLFLDLD